MFGHEELQNRFGYHRATAESAPKHAQVRTICVVTAQELDELLPDGRDKSLAMTALQEVMHWANSAIAMENDVDTETAHVPNAPNDSYRDLLLLLVGNLHVGVSNEDIVIEDYSITASASMRAALTNLLDEATS